jgi:lysozyme
MIENIINKSVDIIKKNQQFKKTPYLCNMLKAQLGYDNILSTNPDKKYGGIFGCQITKFCNDALAKSNGNIKKANILIAKQYPNLITEQEANDDLYESVKTNYWGRIGKELPKGLTDEQCASIISFVYNIGVSAFRASTMFKLLQAGKFDKAGNELKKWVFVNGKKSKGLENRRKDETDLYFK